MKTWMLPWLFPVGLLATVVFFTVLGRYAGLVVVGVLLLLAPVVLWRVQAPSSREDADTRYWRFGRR
jgi:Ca2+/Na+ antiporter